MKSLQTNERCKVMAIAYMAFGQVRGAKKICPYWFIVAFHFVLWNIQIIILCTKRKMDSYIFYLFHFCETNLKWIFFQNEQSDNSLDAGHKYIGFIQHIYDSITKKSAQAFIQHVYKCELYLIINSFCNLCIIHNGHILQIINFCQTQLFKDNLWLLFLWQTKSRQ